ncbi:MAG: response regulator [Acidobacteriota bacterium]
MAVTNSTETLLVVDDEETVRRLVVRILTQAGYRVLSASDGKEALNIYQENHNEIRLVLLDLLMPSMSGHSLLQVLLRINPAIKVLVVSGASTAGGVNGTLTEGAQGIISKPFRAEELLSSVRRLLERR